MEIELDDDTKNIKYFMEYITNDKLTCGLGMEEMLWVIKEIRKNPKIKLLDALENARFEWSYK
jgi:hypothetical protein